MRALESIWRFDLYKPVLPRAFYFFLSLQLYALLPRVSNKTLSVTQFSPRPLNGCWKMVDDGSACGMWLCLAFFVSWWRVPCVRMQNPLGFSIPKFANSPVQDSEAHMILAALTLHSNRVKVDWNAPQKLGLDQIPHDKYPLSLIG